MRIESMPFEASFSLARHDAARKTIGWVMLSLALHAMLLAWVNMPTKQDSAPALLIKATLRTVLAPMNSVSMQRPADTKTDAPAPRATPITKSAPAEKPRPATQEVRQPPSPSEPRPLAEVDGAARPTVKTSTASTPAVTAPPTPAANAPDQNKLLGGYAQQISRLLAGHQEYPRLAAMRGWEGEVRLRLKIARKGNLLSIQVDHSSGYSILDQHALQLVDLAGNLPAMPDEMEGQEIQVIVPVNYKLRKAA